MSSSFHSTCAFMHFHAFPCACTWTMHVHMLTYVYTCTHAHTQTHTKLYSYSRRTSASFFCLTKICLSGVGEVRRDSWLPPSCSHAVIWEKQRQEPTCGGQRTSESHSTKGSEVMKLNHKELEPANKRTGHGQMLVRCRRKSASPQWTIGQLFPEKWEPGSLITG